MSGRALGGAAGPSLTVAQVIAVADATRRRIERDLHDGLQQQLVSLALRVRAAEAMVPAELLELRAELSGVVDEHTNLLDQLREIAQGIHPAILSENGLTPALKSLARRSPIPVELKVRVDARLPEEVELAAYYIVAEALTNTAKYSRASLVDVLVQTRGRTLRVAVRDDGVGGADPARGTGLLGLKKRAEAIGGIVSLHSPPAAVAQELTLLRPRLVRRLVLAGTAPQGGPDLHRWSDTVFALATRDQPTAEDLLSLFFSPSEESRAKGAEYLQRAYQRQEDRDAPTDLATRDAQLAAITAWGIPDASRLNRLAGITQPTLVVNGDDDRMLHTKNSRLLAEQLPNAELQIYPDANHGFLDQYPELFADDIVEFLNR